MVTRKPLNSDLIPRPLSQAANNPPYPTTPPDEHPPTQLPPTNEAQQEPHKTDNYDENTSNPNISTLASAKQLREDTKSDDGLSIGTDSEDEWNSDDFEEIDAEDDGESVSTGLPDPLKVGTNKPTQTGVKPEEALPATLRVGPPTGLPKSSQESLKAAADIEPKLSNPQEVNTPPKDGAGFQSHNPFLSQMRQNGQTTPDPVLQSAQNPSEIWSFDGVYSGSDRVSPAELPAHKTPIEQVSQISLIDQPSGVESPTSRQPALISVEHENAGNLLMSGAKNGGKDPERHQSWEYEKEFDEFSNQRNDANRGRDAFNHPRAEINDEKEVNTHEQSALLNPPLPPRPSSQERPPTMPPRPINTAVEAAGPEILSPASVVKKQRKEHYQIKHIRWFDSRRGGIRPSPILVQNLNGPCPLLALVNALILSTPPGEETALIENLRTREQVSLGLLLDAVFDELMSGRRGGAAQELPDVGELYSFLITLHTGMNVNPRFVKAPAAPNSNPWRMPEPSANVQNQPGGFEDTKEMRLYSTFNMPLIHGWLPREDSRAYAAFNNCAKTYEDAQNVQFNEEELDAKLRSQGLTSDEQKLFEDVHSIKEFLNRWPTQLTDYGLEVIAKTVQPGQIAIFFRNDHFSTLYKEPRTGQIYTLVTDAGYASHEEIVWEKLVDVNGQGSELFSGDFRSVGHNVESSAGRAQAPAQERPIRSLLDFDDDQGWTTIEPRNRRNNASQGDSPSPSRPSYPAPQPPVTTAQPATNQATNTASNTEQEDHDLALALQLQEEEEDRHRREVEARRAHENALSHQFLSAEQQRAQQRQRAANSGTNPPLIPPRRNNNNNNNNNNNHRGGVAVHRPASSNGEEAPPSYEQAASGPAFHPPSDHPASPHAPATGAGGGAGGGRGARSRIAGARPTTQQHHGSAYGSMAGVLGSAAQGGGRGRRPLRQGMPGQNVPAFMQQVPVGSRPGRRQSGAGGMAGANAAGGPGTVDDRDKCVVM